MSRKVVSSGKEATASVAEGKHTSDTKTASSVWKPGQTTIDDRVVRWVPNPKDPREGSLQPISEDSETVPQSDEKETAALMILKKSLSMAKDKGGKAGVKGLIKGIWLSYKFSNTSGVNAGNNAVVPVQPGSTTEIGSWAALYDEFNCDAAEFHFNIATPGNTVLYGIAYDPVNSGTFGSVAALANTSNMKLGSIPYMPSVGTMAVTATDRMGLQTLKVRVPKMGSARDSSSSTVFGGSDWAATGTYGNDVWGFFKPYCEAAGAGFTTTIFGIVRMRCNFRMRT